MNLSGKEPELQEGSDIPFYCLNCKEMSDEFSIGKGCGKGKGKGKGKCKSSTQSATASASASVSDVVHSESTQNVTQPSVSSRG